MKLRFTSDVADLERYLTQQATAFDEAADAAVIGTTEELKAASRQQIGGALSARASNLFASRYFNQRRAAGSVGVVGFTHSRWWRSSAAGQRVDILAEYETGATITPVRGKRIAIPLPTAGKLGLGLSGNRTRLTPESFERKTGLKLRQVKAADGRIFLVADGRVNNAGLARGFKGGQFTKTGRLKSKAATVPVFVLVASTSLPKRLDLGQLADRAQNSLGARVLAELNRRDGAA